MGNLRTKLSKSTIFDAGNAPPPVRMVTLSDGTVAEEKYPRPAHEKWVTKEGHVVRVLLANGSRNRATVNAEYAELARWEQRNAGHIPYGRCPLRDEDSTVEPETFPEKIRRACEKGTYGEAKACPHVEHLIKVRRTAHVARVEAEEAKRETVDMKRLKLERERLEKQDRMLEALLAQQSGAAAPAPAPAEPAKKAKRDE